MVAENNRNFLEDKLAEPIVSTVLASTASNLCFRNTFAPLATIVHRTAILFGNKSQSKLNDRKLKIK